MCAIVLSGLKFKIIFERQELKYIALSRNFPIKDCCSTNMFQKVTIWRKRNLETSFIDSARALYVISSYCDVMF